MNHLQFFNTKIVPPSIVWYAIGIIGLIILLTVIFSILVKDLEKLRYQKNNNDLAQREETRPCKHEDT